MKVVAATKNPGQPWGRRPYHRPDCSETRKKGRVPRYWTTYPSEAAARADKRRPCTARMARQGFDISLTRYDERGWRATFYVSTKLT